MQYGDKKSTSEKKVGYAEYVTKLMSSIALNYKKDYRIAITPGDPAGIGPDILLDYIQNHEENTKWPPKDT